MQKGGKITKKLTCIVVDDEQHCLDALKRNIAEMPMLKLLGAFSNPLEAVKVISSSKSVIDFLLLDIDMPKLSGLEVAYAIRHKVDKLIFVTAHSKYSLAAYDVLCNQYLLKPYSQQKFEDTISRLITMTKNDDKIQLGSIFVKTGENGKYLQLSCDDIISISALEHYIIFNTKYSKYIQHISIKEAETFLCPYDNFIRVHKSHIISTKHILHVYGNKIMLTNNQEIPLGATYKEEFKHFLYHKSIG